MQSQVLIKICHLLHELIFLSKSRDKMLVNRTYLHCFWNYLTSAGGTSQVSVKSELSLQSLTQLLAPGNVLVL